MKQNIVSCNPQPSLRVAVDNIRVQLAVNLQYAADAPLTVDMVQILNGHIEDLLKEIERHASLMQMPYPKTA